MSNERIFITGGASGLGLALARRYGRAGFRVCIGDVNDERGEAAVRTITEAGAASVRYLHCDVTREEDLAAAAETLVREWGGVDIVVNNAGVAQAGAIEDVSLDDWQWILDINLLGVVRGCKVFTPIFKRQGHGHFVNIASMAGLLDVPKMSSYNVSKAGVVSLSETLQIELWDAGIGVTLVCPAFFKTNLNESLRSTDDRLRTIMNKLFERAKVTADDIADQVFEAVRARKFRVLSHPDSRFVAGFKRHAPRRLWARVMERQTRRLR